MCEDVKRIKIWKLTKYFTLKNKSAVDFTLTSTIRANYISRNGRGGAAPVCNATISENATLKISLFWHKQFWLQVHGGVHTTIVGSILHLRSHTLASLGPATLRPIWCHGTRLAQKNYQLLQADLQPQREDWPGLSSSKWWPSEPHSSSCCIWTLAGLQSLPLLI